MKRAKRGEEEEEERGVCVYGGGGVEVSVPSLEGSAAQKCCLWWSAELVNRERRMRAGHAT